MAGRFGKKNIQMVGLQAPPICVFVYLCVFFIVFVILEHQWIVGVMNFQKIYDLMSFQKINNLTQS